MPVDAYAYLIRHGWSGPGNPLNPDGAGARGGLGLTKPLLVARRSGNSGVGNKTTKDPTNQWWLRGFEDALKGIGTGNATGETGPGMKGNALTSELYRFFVRGEGVPGTIGGVKSGMEDKGGGKKRKREEEEEEEEEGESKEGRKLRKEEKRRRKIEKRERRRERKERKMKKAEGKPERKKRKAEEKKEKKPAEDYPTPVSMDLISTDAQEGGSSLDTEKLEKLKKKEKKDKKEKERKKDKSLKEGKKSKREST